MKIANVYYIFRTTEKGVAYNCQAFLGYIIQSETYPFMAATTAFPIQRRQKALA